MSRFRFVFAALTASALGAGAKELLIHRELATLPPPRYQTAGMIPGHEPPPSPPAPTPHEQPGAL
ncbi:MAG TPA: hypothetical protein VEU30_16890 [Thermoanaerobaculia bacterium]|nr:hypothetical protein [Thermoanaerobaculia bacterium]